MCEQNIDDKVHLCFRVIQCFMINKVKCDKCEWHQQVSFAHIIGGKIIVC